MKRPSSPHCRWRLVRRSVDNPRYSECGSAKLSDLDWSHWWTDTSFGAHYLHVAHKDGETSHRVYARGHVGPRLEMLNGKLMWLYNDKLKHAGLATSANQKPYEKNP